MTVLSLPPIIGESPAIRKATELIERFAPTVFPILLVGPTGTGKELFARHIHYRSGRLGPLVDVNCGALPHELAESLLFGHRKGAFTGAVESITGHLERAHRGTLFLDEVMHLSSASQVRLLRAIELGEVLPLGESQKKAIDIRVVAAAQDDLAQRVEGGVFRTDLLQRLAGIVIHLPALLDRTEDIVPLAQHFASARGQQLEIESLDILTDHHWPGNVRELRLAIERAGLLVEDGSLPPQAVRDAIALGILQGRQHDRRLADRRNLASDRRERKKPTRSVQAFLATCQAENWNISRIATNLGIPRPTVYTRLRRAGIALRSVKRSSIIE